MKRIRILSVVAGLVGLMVIRVAVGNGDHKYIGIKKCQMCHKSKTRGEQVQQWQGSEHAQAFAHLGTPEAKEIAKKAGVTGDPQKAGECLSCHVTGHSAPEEQKEATLTVEEGVSCEACHGPGSSFWKMSTMKKVAAGEMDPKEVGLITPDKTLCVKCHNEKRPSYVEFDFEKRYAEIIHPAPKKE